MLALVSAFAFQSITSKKDLVRVDKVENMYIFIDAKPVAEYETIGTVKATFGLTGQFGEVKTKLINKVYEDYPNADGLIFNFKNLGSDKAEVIKFK